MQWVRKNVFSNELHVEQLAIIGGGPLVGKLIDNFPRVPAYICLNVVQVFFFSIIIFSSRVVNYLFLVSFFLLRICSLVLLVFCQASAQLLSASMIIYAHTVPHASTSSMLLRPWFIVLVLAAAVERLFGVATGVAMERDWVVLVVPFYTCSFICTDGYPFQLG